MTNSSMIGLDFERYHESLYLAGRAQLRGRLVSKVDVQGVVQDTFLEAWQQQESWRSAEPRVRKAWIHRAFQNNLVDETRRFRRQSRDVSRERSLDYVQGSSGGSVRECPVSAEPPPGERAIQCERTVQLQRALAQLPDAQRQAVGLRHLQGMTLREVGQKLHRTDAAVAGLIYRGLQRLRSLLEETTEGQR